VQQYTAELQGTLTADDERRLREKIIDLCLKLPGKPAVPDEATRHFVRGATFARQAKSKDEFRAAADEYHEGLKIAPCVSDGYFNYALVLEGGDRLQAAADALKLYLRAAPDAPDAPKMKAKIYELEATTEMAARRAGQEAEGKERARAALAGRWSMLNKCSYDEATYEINIGELTGNEFQITGGPSLGSFKGGRMDGGTITMSWSFMFNTVTYTGKLVSPSLMEGTYVQSVLNVTCTWRASKL
jgi:hypothetical protein